MGADGVLLPCGTRARLWTRFFLLGQRDSFVCIKLDVKGTPAALTLRIANAIGSSPSDEIIFLGESFHGFLQFQDNNQPVFKPSCCAPGTSIKAEGKCVVIPAAASSRELDITLYIHKWKGSTEIPTPVHVAAMLTTTLRELVEGAEQQVQASRGSSSVLCGGGYIADSTVKEAILAGYITTASLAWSGSRIFVYDEGCELQLKVHNVDSLQEFQLPSMPSGNTVADLKNEIEAVVSIPSNELLLFYDGVKVSWMPEGLNETGSISPTILIFARIMQG